MIVLPRSQVVLFGGLASLMLAGGCAHQYHWYQADGCCPQYEYCAPAPLPYSTYCGCPTPFARYHSTPVSVLQGELQEDVEPVTIP